MDSKQLVDHQAISTYLRKSKTSGAFVWNLVFVAEVIALAGLWELISGPLEVMNPKFLPPPSAILTELWRILPIVGESPITDDLVFSLKNFAYEIGRAHV